MNNTKYPYTTEEMDSIMEDLMRNEVKELFKVKRQISLDMDKIEQYRITVAENSKAFEKVIESKYWVKRMKLKNNPDTTGKQSVKLGERYWEIKNDFLNDVEIIEYEINNAEIILGTKNRRVTDRIDELLEFSDNSLNKYT